MKSFFQISQMSTSDRSIGQFPLFYKQLERLLVLRYGSGLKPYAVEFHFTTHFLRGLYEHSN